MPGKPTPGCGRQRSQGDLGGPNHLIGPPQVPKTFNTMQQEILLGGGVRFHNALLAFIKEPRRRCSTEGFSAPDRAQKL